jgi:uncharacterized membrane protein
MVTSTRTASRLRIIARPNCSASWRSNQLVLLLLAIPSLTVAGAFALIGAWPILPIMGLELAGLAAALYYVSWKLQYRQVITLEPNAVRIDKGYYTPQESWVFRRDESALDILAEPHPWDGPELCLHDKQCQVAVGEFLNREECLQLAGLLRQELRVGTDSRRSELSF